MTSPKILLLNQVAGPLFRELAEDLAVTFEGAELLSGHMDDVARAMSPALKVRSGPDYDRRNLLTRAWSWTRFFFRALRMVFSVPSKRPLLIVSNPPFLPLVGWLASVLRGQRYAVLVYDLYPAVLVQLGKLSAKGPISIVWRAFNRMIWSRAEVVFTIGEHMAQNMRIEAPKIPASRIMVVPIWVDVNFIKPIPKADNPFVRSLGWENRKIVLYSGNLGNTHNIEGLLEAAVELNDRNDIGILIIGSGALWERIEQTIVEKNLNNVRLLPWQHESLLPQTLPAGDISIVSMEAAIAGYMIPSKTFYYMAAGAAIMALVPPRCEVADIVEKGECGVRLDPDDAAMIADKIIELVDNPERLNALQKKARKLAELQYSRDNTRIYADALKDLVQQSA